MTKSEKMNKAQHFAPICSKEEDSFHEVMEKISSAGKFDLPSGIAVMLSGEGKVSGILTDGDIRKALLKGATLDDPVTSYIRHDPITIKEQELKENPIAVVARKLSMSNRFSSRIDKIIVVNNNNQLVDIIGINEIVRISDVRSQTVVVVGQGFVGLTLSLAMANIGFNVIGVEKNIRVVEELNNGRVHFHETGMEDTLNHCLKLENYRCVNSIDDLSFDVVIIAVNTPINTKTLSTDLTNLHSVCVELAPHIRKGHVIIQRSTAPVGTARKLMEIFEEMSELEAGIDFHFVVAPERTIEGEALKEVRSLPQVIGGINEASAEFAAHIFKPLVSLTVIVESMEAAELGKLICNASRLVSFSFANQVALLSDQYNIDAHRLIKAVNEGYPRNQISLPSPGVGGTCLKKDPYLLHESDHFGIASSLVMEARKISDQMPLYVTNKIIDFKDKYYHSQPIKIFLLGFAFKGHPETSDTRDSTAWDVVKRLIEKDASLELYGFDPVIPKEELSHPNVKFVDLNGGMQGANAIVFLNNHKFFGRMDIYKAIESVMRPCLIFDTWDILHHEGVLAEDGIIVQTLGSRQTSSKGV